jgi:hypothetical protein
MNDVLAGVNMELEFQRGGGVPPPLLGSAQTRVKRMGFAKNFFTGAKTEQKF